MTNDSYIHQSPNQVGIHQIWFIHTTKWGYTKCLYMTKIEIITSSFPCIVGVKITSYDSWDFKRYTWNLDQRPKQDHDNYQQLSYTIYDLHHKHMSAASRITTCICSSSICKIRQYSFNIINPWLGMPHIDINSSSWPYQDQLAPFP